jgi:formate dehydrogenase major subunit
VGITRREFLKFSAAGAAGIISATASKAFGQKEEAEEVVQPRGFPGKIGSFERKYAVCPFCSVGCNLVLYLRGDQIAHLEADTESPINGDPQAGRSGKLYRSNLCPKALTGWHMVQRTTKRIEKVQVRKAGANTWTDSDYPAAVKTLADKIVKTRDATFISRSGDRIANRCEGIAFIGGTSLTNEVCYCAAKLFRSLGLVYLDCQARDTVAPATIALKETFGRPGATNHFPDIKHAKAVMIVGANPGSDAPVAMRWVFDACDTSGAKVICVDPRLTQTAAKAHFHARIRPGTDLALIGGIINHVLKNKKFTNQYVLQYTDAAFLLDKDFCCASDTEGVFSGLVGDKYDRSTWRYKLDAKGVPVSDETLAEPRTVLNVLKKHFQRYEPDIVCRITGVKPSVFEDICKVFSETGSPGSSGAILFGRGVMQQAQSTQIIRALAILQLLLGNIGVPGGGLFPLYPEGNGQGAADFGLLWEFLPGYLAMPIESDAALNNYVERCTPKTSDRTSFNKMKSYNSYIVSLLKAFYGNEAVSGNDFHFDYLPRVEEGKDYSLSAIFEAIDEGKIKGLIVFGENPALGPNGTFRRRALAKLEWLAVFDSFENETAAFWKTPKENLAGSKTEVYLFPATMLGEHSGTLTNCCRWVQWQDRALVSIPEARKDGLAFLSDLVRNLKSIYSSRGESPDPINHLTWEFLTDEGPKPELVMWEIAGQDLKTGTGLKDRRLLDSDDQLAADGTTSAGNFLYCGCAKRELQDRDKARDISREQGETDDYRQWAFAWPNNIRVMYNRACVNPITGNSWNPGLFLTSFATKTWDAKDVLDGPDDPPERLKPFIALPEGVGKLFVSNLVDGPIPEYYEPLETVSTNILRVSPVQKVRRSDSVAGTGKEKSFPVIAVTFGLAEHYLQHTGTRSVAITKELTPAFFVEIGRELAAQLGVSTGEKVIVRSARSSEGIRATAVVTNRLEPIEFPGGRVHIIGIPDNFGFLGLFGECANALDLAPSSGDMNSGSSACRSFLCSIVKV